MLTWTLTALSTSLYLKGEWEKFDSRQGDILNVIGGFKFWW